MLKALAFIGPWDIIAIILFLTLFVPRVVKWLLRIRKRGWLPEWFSQRLKFCPETAIEPKVSLETARYEALLVKLEEAYKKGQVTERAYKKLKEEYLEKVKRLRSP